jgi:hypothetical protein
MGDSRRLLRRDVVVLDVVRGNRTVCDPNPCGANANRIFADGFNLGDTGAWSIVIPLAPPAE